CQFYCLDAADGHKLWQFETAGHIESSPCVADGKVFFGAGDDGLYCLDAGTGSRRWHFQGPFHIDTSPAVAGGRVYAGSGVRPGLLRRPRRPRLLPRPEFGDSTLEGGARQPRGDRAGASRRSRVLCGQRGTSLLLGIHKRRSVLVVRRGPRLTNEALLFSSPV